MTPSEFKAWFEGFTEAFDHKIPTKVQWGRIKERVAEIDGKPITERVYVDRWYPTLDYFVQCAASYLSDLDGYQQYERIERRASSDMQHV